MEFNTWIDPSSTEIMGEVTVSLDDETYANGVFGPSQLIVEYLQERGMYELAFLIEDTPGIVGYITGVEVDEELKRRGIGTKMLKKVLAVMRDRDVQTVWLHAQSSHHTTHANLRDFYERLGFYRISDSLDWYPVYTKEL